MRRSKFSHSQLQVQIRPSASDGGDLRALVATLNAALGREAARLLWEAEDGAMAVSKPDQENDDVHDVECARPHRAD